MRVLVTGATGFVGKLLVKRLWDLGHEVVGTFEKGDAPREYRHLELMDPSSIAESVRGSWERVIHLAGVSGTKEAQADPGRAWNINVVGTQTLVAGLANNEVKPSVLFVSTADVYGEGAGRKNVETDRLAPRSLYAASKAAAEIAASGAASEAGVNLMIARPWPHTGPGQQDDRLLTRWIDALKGDGRIEINTDIVRDYLHVYDVVEAYVRLITSNQPGVYNIASGVGVRFGDLLEKLSNVMGVRPSIRQPKSASDGAMYSVGDPAKIHAVTGWRAQLTVENAIVDLVETRKHAQTH